MSGDSNDTTMNLNDGRKQALHALISSLAPNGSEEKVLSEEQVNALSDRLEQFLGNIDEGPEVKRNEKGELLNEEGLPIIDISEPVDDASRPSQSSEAFFCESNPPPLCSLSEHERQQLRIRRDRILDILEEEERLESEKELERERVRSVEEVAKMDAQSKAAAREMQKKMGKALLQNLAAQRSKEQEERRREEEAIAAAKTLPQNADGSPRKPRKSVSFANVPEIDETKPKPKPPVAWGDVSVAKLKTGLPKARLKAESLNDQPMKLDVVERIPGEERKSHEERDSDDESDPDMQDRHESTPSLDGEDEDSEVSTEQSEESGEDELDFSQASVQRQVALEYIRLREKFGAEARQAMTSHTHDGEDEWDRPKVPLDASLASKPSKSGASRFKAARQANPAHGDASISLGASILPRGKSSTLQKAVRTAKLENGQLLGGEAGESEDEDDESENVKRMMEMLKNGVIVDEATPPVVNSPAKNNDGATNAIERVPSSSEARTLNQTSGKASRFLRERTSQRPSAVSCSGPSVKTTFTSSPVSPVLNTVIERPASEAPAPPVSVNHESRAQGLPNPAFKKPPTVISASSISSSQRLPFSRPQIPLDPAVLSNMIVESPSFPSPSARAPTQPGSSPLPLVSEVRESARRAGMSEEHARQTGKISRFKVERL